MTETIAPDGRRYHEDGLKCNPSDNEVEVIQYLRPNARRRRVFAMVEDKEIVEASRNMIISAELDMNNVVAIYVRFKDEPAENEWLELASNGPGVTSALIKAICIKLEQRKRR